MLRGYAGDLLLPEDGSDDYGYLARRLGYRAMSSYLAGAIIFPYTQFLADAEAAHYDIAALQQAYTASFEQVAHRLVTLRKPGESGVPFGFLRSEPQATARR